MWTATQCAELREGAAEWGLSLDAATLDRFGRLIEMLEEANRSVNLTRVPPEESVTRHLLDSLSIAAVSPPGYGFRVIDVGTGAGFPGLPLALAYPDCTVTLLDGTRKKLDFIDTAIRELGITNARTIHGRVEEIGRLPQHRGRYQLTTARAVASLSELAGWMLPLIEAGGSAVAYKSRDVDLEIAEAAAAVRRAGGAIERVVRVTVPGTDVERQLVVLRKEFARTGAPQIKRRA